MSTPRPSANLVQCLAVAAVFFTVAAAAQTHKIAAPETVTRAVGVYEWTGDLARPTAARLVPVSLFIDGELRDAGTFYARPVPLALLNGNIYSLEKAGVPQGIVTLEYARHLQTATSTGNGVMADLGWFGYGNFAAPPPPKKAPLLQAAHNPSAIVSSKDRDSKPRFASKSDKASTDKSSAEPPPTLSKSAPAPSSAPASTAPSDDPDRPHLSKSPSATADKTSTEPASTVPATSSKDTKRPPAKAPEETAEAPDSDRPTLRHRDPKQAEQDRKARAQSGVSAIPGTLANDPDRPTMKRGTPAGAEAAPTQLSGLPAALHQRVAVSDAITREVHPFARDWASPTEQAEITAKLQQFAQGQLADYSRRNDTAQRLLAPAPKYTRPSTRHSVTLPPGPPTPQTLASEQISSYSLSYGGLPTFVYTAVAPLPSTTTSIAPPERYITLITQLLPSGEMQLALASVTDAAHLDRTPWLRLVDVVDPDASHRASILFELRGQTTRQFALYRILSAKADQIFATTSTE